jgi:uncharacterized protein with GYD domain
MSAEATRQIVYVLGLGTSESQSVGTSENAMRATGRAKLLWSRLATRVGYGYLFRNRLTGEAMAMYLTRFSYTPETWARMIENPEDRRKAARSYIESVGGKLHGFWYAFGEHDGWNLWEAPDNVSMTAVALAIGSGGALRSIETTVLLSVEELMEALGKAKSIKYRPPGA